MSGGEPREPGAPSPGPEHDAWLREALRHAPDASAAPPPTLRDAILAEARAAARTAAAPRSVATPSLLARVLEFWSWLARPQVAAGFASVMAATLVGMLWWDRPIDETMLPPPSSPPAAAAPEAAAKQDPAASARSQDSIAQQPAAPAAAPPMPRDAAPAPAPAKSARPPAAREPDAATAQRSERQDRAREAAGEKTVPPADARARAATEDERAERKERAAKLDVMPSSSTAAPKATSPATPPATSATPAPAPAPAPVAPAAVTAVAPTPFPARVPSGDDALSQRPAPVAAPRPAPPLPLPMEAAAPAPTTPQPGVASGRAEPFALQKKAESGDKDGAAAAARPAAPVPPALRAPAPTGALGRSSLDSAEASAGGRVAAQNAAEAAPRQPSAFAAAAQRPMAPLLAALNSEDARWSRRLASGDSVAVDSAVRAWLAQVQTAAPRWETAAERSARRDAPAASSLSVTLLLERDGRSGAIVRIGDGGVLFDPVTGPAWFAPLAAEAVARLRATLPPATR